MTRAQPVPDNLALTCKAVRIMHAAREPLAYSQKDACLCRLSMQFLCCTHAAATLFCITMVQTTACPWQSMLQEDAFVLTG